MVVAAAGLAAIMTGSVALGAAAPASAAGGAQLTTTIIAPAAQVGSPTNVTVRVTNTGSQNSAAPWSVTIQLPQTNTSPTRQVLGTVGALPSGCARSGSVITCTMTTPLKRNPGLNVRNIPFTITLPYSTAPITLTATATASNNIGTANSATATLAQTYVTPAAPPATMTVSHCTGRNLISYFECQLYPSSISGHSVTLAPGGVLDFTVMGEPTMGGTWAVSGTQLTMTYTDGGTPVGTFVGQGTTANCWEGAMTFTPASQYMSMYRVCR